MKLSHRIKPLVTALAVTAAVAGGGAAIASAATSSSSSSTSSSAPASHNSAAPRPGGPMRQGARAPHGTGSKHCPGM